MPSWFVPAPRGRRHAATIALALTALVAPATAAGQASPTVEVEHSDIAAEILNPCTGDVAAASGQATLVTRHVVDAVGGEHFAFIGTAVAVSEEGVSINHQADAGPSNFNANGATNVTDVIQILVVSSGPEDNSMEHINHTDAITPAGDRTSEALNVRQECLG
jgi:hypothetical protein